MNKIKTAILSYGMSGKLFHAPFIHLHEGFELSAVWERSKNLAEEKYPQIKTYRTYEEILKDTEIELIVVNTPNYTHFDYTRKALEAGKHVIVEKPFVTSVKEGEELIEIAKKKGKTISVYQNRRFDSDYRTVKKIVNEGILGDIVEAEFHFDRYKAELSPKTHKESPIAGSGALFDLGSHIIDQALELFGKPDSIFADIRIIRPLSQVNDYFEILMFYPHLRVRLHCSYIVKEALPAYILHGTSGSFIKAKTDVQENALLAGNDPADPEWGLEPEKDKGLLNIKLDGSEKRGFIESQKGNYYDYYDSIFHMIRNNSQNPVTPEEGLEVIRVIEAANKSVEDQKIIPFK